ncbi:MAG TPA: GNAT family N-acetyltransferase [Bacteroides sp.]|nr:GNAT family N-acetyltransferase [Bacteroides sp.]
MTFNTNIEGFSIRSAEENDVPLILWFIKGLADYEKLSYEVVATEDLLQKNLFGEKPTAEVVIGEYNSKPVGFALFFHSFSTFVGKPGIYLEDLFVVPEMRGRGFGKALLQFLARLTVERDCGSLEWAVLDWNEPAIKFYESIGARIMKEWLINRLSGKELTALASQS